MYKETVIETQVSTGTYADFIHNIITLPKKKTSSYVCFANVHMVVESYKDLTFRTIVNNADVIAPDGKPISVYLNLLKGYKQEKVSGPDLFIDLLKECEKRKMRVFFYGSTEEVLSKVRTRIGTELPALTIAGTLSPPFRELSREEKNEVVSIINSTEPDLIFVSLGCPKQEKWMAEHLGIINGCVLGVGQALGIYAGLSTRCPKKLQEIGLEWAYRLYHEPARLWKRYTVTNSFFLFLIMKYSIAMLFGVDKLRK
jgi:N-acetylglucosaminyldiphosphoundecaprenol N-acetyl-beta-D-mannosaminyltransferase